VTTAAVTAAADWKKQHILYLQLSLKALVVKTSRNATMWGELTRFHWSMTVIHFGLVSLKPEYEYNNNNNNKK